MSRWKTVLIVFFAGVFSVTTADAEDICDYKIRDWSQMRGYIVDFSKQKINAEVAKAARSALLGAKTHGISTFEIVYGRGKTGEPAPNDEMCYPKAVNFRYWDDDSVFSCVSTWRSDETLATLKCELFAG